MEKPSFEPRLESLRGIAAFIVAIHHTFWREAPGSVLNSIADVILWPTHNQACVLFFFVLSGYVLGLALERQGAFFPYITRRAFRILPLFVVSVLFAYASVTLAGQGEGWPMRTTGELWDNLLLRSFLINGPTWSIYPEIIGSIWLPLLVFLHGRCPHRWRWPLFILVSTVMAFSPLRLVFWFYCGFFLPGEISKILGRSWLIRTVVFVAGYALVFYIATVAEYYKFKTIGPSAIGASMMIGAVISSSSFMTWLNARPLRFLGRVSYSFYLLHWPVYYLWSVAYIALAPAPGFAANFLLSAASISTALVVSQLTYAYIELPFIDLGKKFAAAIFVRSAASGDLQKQTD